jgi:hypothetical protein
MSDHTPPAERTGLFATPLPRFLLQRWLPEEAWPLYLRLTGYGYARPDRAQRWFLFHWTRLLALPFIFPAVWLAMTTDSQRLQIAGGVAAALAMLIAGTGMVVPQPFPPWLARAGRDGFLADLALTELDGPTIIKCHYLARAAPVACFFLPFVVLFYSMFCASYWHNGFYWHEFLYFQFIFLFGIVVVSNNQGMSYYQVIQGGTSPIKWILRILFISTGKAILLMIIAFIPVLVIYFFLMFSPSSMSFKTRDSFFVATTNIFIMSFFQIFIAFYYNKKLVLNKVTNQVSSDQWSRCVARELSGGKGLGE